MSAGFGKRFFTPMFSLGGHTKRPTNLSLRKITDLNENWAVLSLPSRFILLRHASGFSPMLSTLSATDYFVAFKTRPFPPSRKSPPRFPPAPPSPTSFSTSAVDARTFRSKYRIKVPDLDFFEYILGDISGHEAKEAIIDGFTGRSLSYGLLKDYSMRLGQSLLQKGYTKGDVVGVMSPNTIDYVVTVLGCAYVGMAVALLNPLETEAVLIGQLEETEAKALFVFPVFGKKAATLSESVPTIRELFLFGFPFAPDFVLSIYGKLFLGQSRSSSFMSLLRPPDLPHYFVRPVLEPENDILILPFSSGTTGRPKGVIHTHSTIVAFIDASVQHPVLRQKAIEEAPSNGRIFALALLPFFHIFGLYQAFTTVAYRGTNVTNPKFHPRLFLRTIQKYQIRTMAIVPPLLDFLSRHPLVPKYDLSSLRTIFCGAAPFNKASADALIDKYPNIKVEQALGLTESILSSSVEADSPNSSCGQLMPNGEARVLDIETGRELDRNETGEIVVHNPTMMKGYLKNPQATAESFLFDDNNKKWLRTGDIGYFDDNDNIFIVDRMKEMIKYKGHQISPTEIERTIRSFPGVLDVGVVGVNDSAAGEIPLAFVVKDNEAVVTAEEVKKHVASSMASYNELRGGVVFTQKIPRSIPGKILRRELKNMLENRQRL